MTRDGKDLLVGLDIGTSKVVTIVALILAGIGIICFGFGRGGVPTGLTNLYGLEGGFLPKGFHGVLLAMTMVMLRPSMRG